ncbi:MAG: 4-alpha-glucanotransferase [Gaiellales bacterium]|nr:4-alpha-glucanotransferase [Gaiellales bacterium]
MTAGVDRRALAELARELGVQQVYVDASGRRRRAPDEAVTAVCNALAGGIDEDGRGAAEALGALRAERAARLAEPVVVAWEGGAPDIALGETAGADLRAELMLEDGGTAEPRPLDAGTLRLPGRLPHGIHVLRLRTGRREQLVRVISAPRQAYQGPSGRWGAFLPLYALPGRFGVGDFDSLRRLIDWTARHGGSFVGSTPIFAAFLDRPFDPSPYAPVSRLFWNELHLDPMAAPELERSAAARNLLESRSFQDGLAALSAGRRVDYRGSMAAKRRVLELLCEALAGDRLEELEALRRSDPELDRYADFRARCEAESAGWREWEGAQGSAAAARYHAYVQWLCREQLAEAAAGGRLYLDMPLGVHPGGFDTWRHQDAFVEGLSVGAPPDALFQGGQNWGFAPIHPERMREEGHAYWLACLRTLLQRASAVRIDHVMGLHRLYCVPHGFAATEGVYVRMPHEELCALLTLESHRSATVLVGEDLGTVPSEVRRSMRRHGILRSFVLEVEIDAQGDPFTKVPAGALAGMNTHDMPTFAGFWEGEDIDRRAELGLIDTGTASREHRERSVLRRSLARALRARGHRAKGLSGALDGSLAELAASPAQLLVVNVEDLWEEREPQNVPGTGFEAGNWQRRAAYGPDEIDEAPGALRRIEAVAAQRGAQG